MAKQIKTQNKVAELVKERMKNEAKLDKIRERVEEITGRSCWNELTFKDGKLIGLLRTIGYEFQHRNELMELTGIPEPLLDIFLESWGHPCFIDKEKFERIEEKRMDMNMVKECLEVAGEIVGYEPHLKDITETKVNNMYEYFRNRVEETLEAI